jgi:hypothetical protein
MMVAALLLGGIALWRGTPADGLCAVAVLLSFGHTTIAERMRERQTVQDTSAAHVECHRLLNLYLIGKEITWVAFFLLSNSLPALLGCILFLFYPVWRKFWRRHHPLRLEETELIERENKSIEQFWKNHLKH